MNKKKIEFDISDYKSGRYAMHCKSEEEATEFLEYLDKNGMRWRGGEKYTEKTLWDVHEEATCYNFINGGYADFEFYKNAGYKILEFEDFTTEDYEVDEEENSELEEFLKGYMV